MRWLVIFLLLCWPLAAVAQEKSDRGFIQGLLEDALSAPGRSVQIEGFAGALSARATIARISVSDPDGVWLTLDDVALVWQRSALLRGRIEIDEISVGRIAVPRLPLPAGQSMPSPEARGAFRLPELPVSVSIAQMQVTEAEIGAPLLGEPVRLGFEGAAQLASGAGNVDLVLERLDAEGRFALKGAFDNDSRRLVVDLNLEEPADGIAARLLTLPGRPSLALSVQGDDPIGDFAADIRLATDGQERLTGGVTLRTDSQEVTRFEADLSGDLAPVVAPQYRDFLGDRVALQARGQRRPDGALGLDDLSLRAAALTLDGAAQLAADGWPDGFDLDIRIAPPEGARVRLPGSEVTVAGGLLEARFDAAAGEAWQVSGTLDGVQTGGSGVARLVLDGDGVIDRADSRVTGRLQLDAAGLDAGTPALEAAIGDALRGALEVRWSAGAPLEVSTLDLSGADYGLTGAVMVENLDDAAALRIVPDVTLSASDLRRFADLAGVDLSGAADLAISGFVAPLTGLLDLRFAGETRALALGLAQVDPVLAGTGRLDLYLRRDEDGLTADPLRIETDEATISGRAALRTGASRASVTAELREVGRAIPALQGPATLRVAADQAGVLWTFTGDAALPGDTDARFRGSLIGDGQTQWDAEGRLAGDIGRLAAFSDLAGRSLNGSARIEASGTADLLSGVAQVVASGETVALRLDIPRLSGLLRDALRFELAAARDGEGTLSLERLTLDGRGLSAALSGRIAGRDRSLQAALSLDDLARVVPQISGAAELRATASGRGDTWAMEADGRLPGGTDLQYRGTLSGDGSERLDLSGRIVATAARLAAFSRLAGRSLGGSARLEADADIDLLALAGSFEAQGRTTDLRIDVPAVEPLFAGTTRFDLSAARGPAGRIDLRGLSLTGPGVRADLSGVSGPSDGRFTYSVAIPDLARIAPDFPGRAAVSGTADRDGQSWRIDASGEGPGGITAEARGRIQAQGPRVDLTLRGAAPLALVNAQLRGQALSGLARFDLAVNGPPQVDALTGRIRLGDARLALPEQGITVEGVTGQADIAAGRAQVDLAGRIARGGDIRLSGPVTLAPPFDAALQAAFSNVVLRDRTLFETIMNGQVTVTGPLTSGAQIGGGIDLETAELRLPQFGPSYSVLDGLRHLNPSTEVQQTLRFAGLGPREDAPGTSGPAFPLDLTVRAPNRVFVRGRGLDAELGGALRLTGTTQAVLPAGQFDLVRGRLDLLGRRLQLTEGAVLLRGSFDPVIAFAATTEVDGTSVTLRLDGLASAPELTVTASPDLPQDEALSLLLFGRDLSSLSPLQAVRLAAAVQTLAGGGPGLTGQLREGLGVDDLDISTDDAGNTQARVGAYVSENIYTDVAVSSGGTTEINLNLDLTPNLTLRGRASSDGNSGIGLFFERDY